MDEPNRTISALPDAADAFGELSERLGDRLPAVFLDYDGTLTPIVDDPADATLDPELRSELAALAGVLPVAVVSGRDLDDVRSMVDLDELAYAGSHGFDLRLADGTRERYGEDYLPDLEEAQEELADALADRDGVRIERKGFAVAVHTRRASDADAAATEADVGQVADRHPRLRVTGGKDIHELRPDIEWDKGRALRRLIEVLGIGDSYAPVYVGDDLTDEDGFAAVVDDGVAVVVTGAEDRPTLAHFRLPEPAAVRGLLRRFRDLAEGRDQPGG